MTLKYFYLVVLLFLIVVLTGPVNRTSLAQHSDLEIGIEDGAVVVEPQVVEAEFGEGLLPPFRLNEPGFEADEGALAPGDVVSIMLPAISIGGQSRSIWFWDAAGVPTFGAAPHELKVTNPGTALSVQVTGLDPSDDLGLAVADASGGLHQDLLFDLVSAAGDGVADPETGVYLWATTVKIPGHEDSRPTFWFAGAGVGEEVIDLAIEAAWQMGVIPEPSALTLLLVTGIPGLCWYAWSTRWRSGRATR